MKYGDLSSIVQLGVGLHVGTAVLQLLLDFGATPLERRIGRIRTLFNLPEHERPPANLGEELDQLESRYELFKIDFFRFFLFGFSEAMHAVGHIGSLKFDRLRPLAAVLREGASARRPFTRTLEVAGRRFHRFLTALNMRAG
jgi:hypothetical protein